MVQEQERSLGLAILAALSLVGWIALYGLLFWYEPLYQSRCPPTNDFCGLGLLGPGYVFTGTGALLGLAAWLGATVWAVRRREVLRALSLGFLLLVALGNAVLVHRHADRSYAVASYHCRMAVRDLGIRLRLVDGSFHAFAGRQ